jgi:hypothetical protein
MYRAAARCVVKYAWLALVGWDGMGDIWTGASVLAKSARELEVCCVISLGDSLCARFASARFWARNPQVIDIAKEISIFVFG